MSRKLLKAYLTSEILTITSITTILNECQEHRHHPLHAFHILWNDDLNIYISMKLVELEINNKKYRLLK